MLGGVAFLLGLFGLGVVGIMDLNESTKFAASNAEYERRLNAGNFNIERQITIWTVCHNTKQSYDGKYRLMSCSMRDNTDWPNSFLECCEFATEIQLRKEGYNYFPHMTMHPDYSKYRAKAEEQAKRYILSQSFVHKIPPRWLNRHPPFADSMTLVWYWNELSKIKENPYDHSSARQQEEYASYKADFDEKLAAYYKKWPGETWPSMSFHTFIISDIAETRKRDMEGMLEHGWPIHIAYWPSHVKVLGREPMGTPEYEDEARVWKEFHGSEYPAVAEAFAFCTQAAFCCKWLERYYHGSSEDNCARKINELRENYLEEVKKWEKLYGKPWEHPVIDGLPYLTIEYEGS